MMDQSTPLPFDLEDGEIIQHEVIEPAPAATDRSVGRRVAVQILYEMDSANHALGEVMQHHVDFLQDHLEEFPDLSDRTELKNVRRYLRRTLNGLVPRIAQIDAAIQQFAPDYPILQLSLIDRNILRLAVYEIALDVRAPLGAVIDEATELGKLFGAEHTSSFINGVLGVMARNLDDVKTLLKPVGILEDEQDDDFEDYDDEQ